MAGNADYAFVKIFESFLKDLKPKITFVILAACHSEEWGRAFFNAGVKHVICVNKNHKLNDRAAIVFSKKFY